MGVGSGIYSRFLDNPVDVYSTTYQFKGTHQYELDTPGFSEGRMGQPGKTSDVYSTTYQFKVTHEYEVRKHEQPWNVEHSALRSMGRNEGPLL